MSETITKARVDEKLSEKELCPDELLKGQEQAFANDILRLQSRLDEFVEVTCPACGASANEFQFSKHEFPYRTCNDCRTLYMSPRPSPAVMDSYYTNSENYAYWAKHIFPASEQSRKEKLHRPWLHRILDLCDKYAVRRRRLVEIGAGFGTFCAVANEEEAFSQVLAIEPTPEMADACRSRGVSVLEKKVEEIGDDVEEADVVVAFEVVEHLFEPSGFFKQAQRLLRPGGLLIVTCPNGEGFDIATLREESLAIDPEHVNLFNPESLSLLAERTGFNVLEVTTPGRLDAEFVRTAVLEDRFDVANIPLLQRVLVDEWDSLGWPFQQFLAENGMSSHMWLAARRQA